MKRIGILGLGLMGASLGLALKSSGMIRAGYARREAVRREAVDQGVVDEVFADPAEAVRDADLVVICLPITKIPALVEAIRDHLKPGAIVTDVGSTKSTLMAKCVELLKETESVFIGSHPIAGSEKQGLAAADPNLYRDAVVIVTPDSINAEAGTPLLEFWKNLGSIVRIMHSQQHDLFLARTSHLPHMVASILAMTVGRELQEETGFFCGTGFRSTSRVAEGSPDVWCDIVTSNRDALLAEMTAYRDTLNDFLAALEGRDFNRIKEFLEQGRADRRALLEHSPLKGEEA